MKQKLSLSILTGICWAALAVTTNAQVPGIINYQGRVSVGGTNFTGTGQFEFALVGGYNTNLQATATIDAFEDNGGIVHVSMASQGLGYTNAPNITITSPTGTGAVLFADVDLTDGGIITNIEVLAAGVGYDASIYYPPVLTIDPPPAGLAYNSYWSNDGSSSNGNQPTAAVPLAVTKGLYSVLLGDTTLSNMTAAVTASVFSNNTVYLRVWFNDGVHGFQQLTPDQRIAAAGYAFTVPDASITSAKIANSAVTSSQIAAGAVTAATIGSGQVVKSLNGLTDTVSLSAGANITLTPSGNSIQIASTGGGGGGGVTSLNALSGAVTLSAGANITLTPSGNNIQIDATGGGGGGTPNDTPNTTMSRDGSGNTAVSDLLATRLNVGTGNTLSGTQASIAGGQNNTASGTASFVGGGQGNQASGPGSFVGGGGYDGYFSLANIASGGACTVGGGEGNTASGLESATVGGGAGNTASGRASTVGGGDANTASGDNATVGGGEGNYSSYVGSTVGGGNYNIASGFWAIVGGGEGNTASNFYSTVAGGYGNQATGPGSFVGGGGYDGNYFRANFAGGAASTVAGGLQNSANNTYATVAGGYQNQATGAGAFIGGGLDNTASGSYSTVPGGSNCVANGAASFVAGAYALANDNNSFLWGDGTRQALSQGQHSFAALCTGGVWFYTGAGSQGLHLDPGGSSWIAPSDRNVKKNFQAVDTVAILDKLATIPIQRWNYKWEGDNDVPNIGPMAQDFKAAFYPGRDDKGISTLEFDGVELAAIQGLNQKLEQQVKEKDTRISALERRLAALEATVQKVSEQLEQSKAAPIQAANVRNQGGL